MRHLLLSSILLGLACFCTPAFAQEFIGGDVYSVARDGVYVQNSNGITFVPAASATFRTGDASVPFGALTVGMPINAYYGPGYVREYVPVDYFRIHRDWDWEHHRREWHRDREHWHHDHDH
jgi:hypothetical protein